LRGGFELRHLHDYGDNALRYFHMTKYIRLRGWETRVDIKPMRRNKLDSLFEKDNAAPSQFAEREELQFHPELIGYADFLSDVNRPALPGENKDELVSTVKFLRWS